MKIVVMKKDGVLELEGDVAKAFVEDMKPNIAYMAEIKRPRNLRFHKLYWAMCARLAWALNNGPDGNIREVHDADSVDRDLRIATGYFRAVKLSTNARKRVSLPSNLTPVGIDLRSISFAKMDQDAFRTFVEACMSHVREVLAPWLEDELATAEVWEPIRSILKG